MNNFHQPITTANLNTYFWGVALFVLYLYLLYLRGDGGLMAIAKPS